MFKPTGRQIRAARSLAGWERTDLARHTGLSTVTIRYIENETSSAKKETIERIVKAFHNVGIEFIENEGVRRLPTGIEIFEGRESFGNFMNYVYEYLERYGGEVFISVTDEKYLQRSVKKIEEHRAKMLELAKSGKITGRILAAEGNFVPTWAEIRRQKLESHMPQVSFFAFGENLALISFNQKNSPYVVLHKSSPFTAAYKLAFDAAWEKAERN